MTLKFIKILILIYKNLTIKHKNNIFIDKSTNKKTKIKINNLSWMLVYKKTSKIIFLKLTNKTPIKKQKIKNKLPIKIKYHILFTISNNTIKIFTISNIIHTSNI